MIEFEAHVCDNTELVHRFTLVLANSTQVNTGHFMVVSITGYFAVRLWIIAMISIVSLFLSRKGICNSLDHYKYWFVLLSQRYWGLERESLLPVACQQDVDCMN